MWYTGFCTEISDHGISTRNLCQNYRWFLRSGICLCSLVLHWRLSLNVLGNLGGYGHNYHWLHRNGGQGWNRRICLSGFYECHCKSFGISWGQGWFDGFGWEEWLLMNSLLALCWGFFDRRLNSHSISLRHPWCIRDFGRWSLYWSLVIYPIV